MAMKQLARRLQPLPLYFILGLTVCLFFLELVIAHLTHSLTLLLDAYHALCNIIVLVGTIISTNHGSGRTEKGSTPLQNSQEELKSLSSLPNKPEMCAVSQPGPERSLRNTFGWARVDVLVMLIGCVFLVCLCFSVVCEALQTLVHISHHDEMHGDVPVLVLGVVALILNLLAYLLIGGYTFHHGSFLHKSEDEISVTTHKEDLRAGVEKRQGLWGLSRDCVGCIVVIICAVVVHCTEKDVAKFVDPLFSILSAALVLLLSYPFIKESACILMQTIPDHINIGSLCSQLLTAFPNVVNVHELHVWKLTRGNVFCTAHIIFLSSKEYSRTTEDISNFFKGKGITHVTIQPEFFKDGDTKELLLSGSDCLMECTGEVCVERHCCASRSPSLESVRVDCHKHKNQHKTKSAVVKCGQKCVSSTSQSVAVLQVAASCASELTQVKRHIETVKAQDEPQGLVTGSGEEIREQGNRDSEESGVEAREQGSRDSEKTGVTKEQGNRVSEESGEAREQGNRNSKETVEVVDVRPPPTNTTSDV